MNIKNIAISKHMMLKDIADAINMNHRTFYAKNVGQRAWKIAELVSIANVLDVSLEELLQEEKKKEE